MISEKLSTKFKICSLIATIFVVYRHAFVINAFYKNTNEASNILIFTTKIISSLTEIAVPIFFIISGFFFFKYNYYLKQNYINMIKKKFQSLFVPFIIWNIVGLGILFLYDKTSIPDSFYEFIQNFFYSEYYGPLWYVRDMMLLMLLVPLFQWIYMPKWNWVLLAIIPLLFVYWIPVDCFCISSEGPLFFVTGGIISHQTIILEKKLPCILSISLFLLWLTISTFCNLWSHEFLHKINTIIGILAFWNIIDFIPQKWTESFKYYSAFSFFIYCTHFYSIKTVKIILAHYFPGNSIVALLTFLVVPLLIILILIRTGIYLKNKHHKFYLVLTGNR